MVAASRWWVALIPEDKGVVGRAGSVGPLFCASQAPFSYQPH